jgi:hypothetical protein
VFKTKLATNGIVEKLKAKLVVILLKKISCYNQFVLKCMEKDIKFAS